MSALVFAMRPKQAAIYYDEVLPAGLGIESLLTYNRQELAEAMVNPNTSEGIKVLDAATSLFNFEKISEEILPKSLLNKKDELRKLVASSSSAYILCSGFSVENDDEIELDVDKMKKFGMDDRYIEFASSIHSAFGKQLHKVLDFTPGNAVFDISLGGDSEEPSAHLVMASAPLVDVSNADWDQILDFRKDKKSRLKLLRFREFFYKNINFNSMTEAQEKLELLKMEYDEAAKKHGFDFTYQSLSSVLNMKAIGGGGILGLIASQAGLGPFSLAIAAAPIVAEIGVFSFHLYGKKHSMAEFQASNPISYLSEVEKKLRSK